MILSDILESAISSGGGSFLTYDIPGYVESNLREDFPVRPYQREAFARFVYFWQYQASLDSACPAHLLMHMATGSGKTLIMAGLMLYLYGQGYRNFLFFVNSTNIIEKTKDNFLNVRSSKYLFARRIDVDGQRVPIREVDNFQNSDPRAINVCFSTVQGLHQSIASPRENGITLDDFGDTPLVMIADEAHHINADTKHGRSQHSGDDAGSWESTVARIHRSNSRNVLLEFTATADLANGAIMEKYSDKILFNYPLSRFRADGYSKDVVAMQSSLPDFERTVQAMLVSQYRKRLFQECGLQVKPVILLKSRTIKESRDFQESFNRGLADLMPDTILRIRHQSAETIVARFFEYCDAHSISPERLCDELRIDFSAPMQISVNSREDSEQKQIAINTLESSTNPYRAVFAVDKLNEGWDVLNLFDIVRLYDTRDTRGGKPGKTTMQEAQLIGRGARYCPFDDGGGNSRYVRKYDSTPGCEMRICEQLYYHASYNPAYIRDLDAAMVEVGIRASANEAPVSRRRNAGSVRKAPSAPVFGRVVRVSLTHLSVEQSMRAGGGEASGSCAGTVDRIRLHDLGEAVVREAIDRMECCRFDNLRKRLPHLGSYTEFVSSPGYLGGVVVEIVHQASLPCPLPAGQRLAIAMDALRQIMK